MEPALTLSMVAPPIQPRALRTDLLVGALIVAFTAVPTDLRVPSPQVLLDTLSLDMYPMDVAANVLGYVPLGLVLRGRRVLLALLLAAALSAFSELTQIFAVDRAPGVIDVATNVCGAGLGLLLARRWRVLPKEIRVGPLQAALAAGVALAYVAVGSSFTVEAALRSLRTFLEAPPWTATNPRGALVPGIIEARLSFDRIDVGTVEDASENRLSPEAVNDPVPAPGIEGSALSLDGKQWIDLGDSVALRLTGSMTLSAWVKPTRFPIDDAAIISSLTNNELGYQLDLTVDQGPRTIGFKLADHSGRLVARYGKTPIALDRWQHVAGVYDSASRTMDVYLNGVLDNGCMLGTVDAIPLATGGRVFVGRRAGMDGFEFIGVIDEVQIESRARAPAEIWAEVGARGKSGTADDRSTMPGGDADGGPCRIGPRPRIAGPLVVLGMLIAVVCVGLWPGRMFAVLTLGACVAIGATAAYWGPIDSMLGSTWTSMACVPFGGGLVIAIARFSGAARARGTTSTIEGFFG